jgi:hypothetical protein
MRILMLLALCLWSVGMVAAHDLGNQAPVKTPQSYPENVPDPVRQGGDTIATATVIPALPFTDTGTTVGRVDDYDEICPYSGSTAPDVVYKYVSTTDQDITFDLCGSAYDTKLYVYDVGLNLIACNDDFYFGAPCGTYVSKLENVPLVSGMTYYIIIDGYGAASGAYTIDTLTIAPCIVECPAGGVPEGEPPLGDDYQDEYNSGCGGVTMPFQQLTGDTAGFLTFCGTTGWFNYSGTQSRDTDWFILTAGASGSIWVTGDAEFATYMFELGPQDCASVGVVHQITAGPCAADTMTLSGYAPGAPVWFWAGPTVFSPPASDVTYDYVVWFSGLEVVIATAPTTWGAVKALYE